MIRKILFGIKNTTIKARIILIFSVITVLLVGLVTRISYTFVRSNYLEQIEDHVRLMNAVIARDLNPRYLYFLGDDQESMAYQFYQKKLADYAAVMELHNAFIFNRDWDILISLAEDISAARLRINRAEIAALQPHQNTASLPFKGADGQWYLWGFYRLDEQHFLGIQENVDRLKRLDYLDLIFLGIALAGILVTVVAAWFLARAIANPINRLVDFSSEIGRGNFKSAIPDGIHGELAILNKALVKMRDDLLNQQEEKEKLLAQIAHEIRNPLGGIELLAGLIREQPDDYSRNAAYIDKIIAEVQGLKAQVTEYLQYSRPVPAHPQDIHLNEIIEEVKVLYGKQLAAKKVRLIHGSSTSSFRFDRNHFRQIVFNLISNSIHAVDEGGTIEIKVSRNSGHTLITLRDDGKGIAEQDLPNIFEPFYTGRKDGIGLGLAICRKLCAENQAQITAANNPDKGCTFSIITSDE